jgi:hypothetical protein
LADALPLLVFAGGSVFLSFAWVWGNGHRHAMFSAAPVAVLTALALPRFAGLDWAVGGLCLGASLVVLARSIHAVGSPVPVQKAINDDARRCMSYLAAQQPGLVLVLPDVAYPPLVYYTDHRILAAGHGLEALTFNRDYLKPMAATAEGLQQVLLRYPVEWLLVLRDGLEVPGCRPAPRPDGAGARPPAPREVFRSGTCAVYRCVPASCADGTSDSTAPNAALARSSRELEWQRLS